MKHENLVVVLFTVAAVLITGYIFANSIQSSEGSHERSEQISEQLQEIVRPDNVNRNSEEWDIFVRKAVHGLEFAGLGICAGGFFIHLSKKRRRRYVSAALFTVLSVAVADEYIQSFTNRSSEEGDIVIDFIGGCFGLLIIVFADRFAKWMILRRRKHSVSNS